MDYSKGTNFTAKRDTTADPAIFDTEFTSVQVASATKTDKIASPTNNNVVTQDSAGNIKDGGKALPSGAVVGTTDAQTLTNKTLTSPTIDLSTVSSAGDLAVTDGGTGSSSASGARTNLGVAIGSDVASQARGVDNGNSHNHSGGDGAAIPTSSLSGTISSSQLSGSTTSSQVVGGLGSTYVLPKGLHFVLYTAGLSFEVQVNMNSGWRVVESIGTSNVPCKAVWSDGTNMRIYNSSSTSLTISLISLA